jgi:acyl-CoA dehydrogenase
VIVAAKTDIDGPTFGLSLVLVPTDSPGFHRGRVLDKIGMKGQDTCELFFDNLRVPATNLSYSDLGVDLEGHVLAPGGGSNWVR